MRPITSACISACSLMAGTGALEAGGELGDGLEAAAAAVGLEQVRRLGAEADAAAVAHHRVDVGGELLAALERGDEGLAAQVLACRLQHRADDLREAPLGQPDVVTLAAVVL